jgi:hypothetical protein
MDESTSHIIQCRRMTRESLPDAFRLLSILLSQMEDTHLISTDQPSVALSGRVNGVVQRFHAMWQVHGE